MGSKNTEQRISSAEGFCQALCHLHDEALAAGWTVPAHFIDVAAEAMQLHIAQCNSNPANDGPVQLIDSAKANDDGPNSSA